MNLTIAELAKAVNQSETYVRQHIHRRHLVAQKDGRNVSVALEEAVRWAGERGLSFAAPDRLTVTAEAMEGRTARITVLTWHAPGAQPRNLFTLMRHRRQDALGPWVNEPDETWSCADLGHELRLFSFDGSYERCQKVADHILDAGVLEIDGHKIQYALQPTPRRHWAYRDDRPLADASVRSPFVRHSAEIVEYWSFAVEPREHWLKVLESSQGKAPPGLAPLGFPLDRRLDRIGNFMIAAAQDGIACDLVATHNRKLRLHVEAEGLVPGAYRATVWASHSGDEVLRQQVGVARGQTVIELASDVDYIGFALLRAADGQCIDLMEEFLTMEVQVLLEMESGPSLHLRHRSSCTTYKVPPSSSVSTISVRSDDDSVELDRGIRRQWLDRRIHEREATERREGNFARFEPDQFEEAVGYFIGLLREGSDRSGPIYLADRYFMKPFKVHKKQGLTRLYLEMFAATTDRPLQILCTERDSDAPPWWSNWPNLITDHVSVRAFLKQDGTPGFHDRYLVTPGGETLITHSLNGWPEGGVTFVRIPYGIYGPATERLWRMDVGSNTEDLYVEEIA